MVGSCAGGVVERSFGGALFRPDRGRPRPDPLYLFVESKDEASGFFRTAFHSIEKKLEFLEYFIQRCSVVS